MNILIVEIVSILIVIALSIYIIKQWILNKVDLVINRTTIHKVKKGSSLLKTLAGKQVFLASSCGGNGICGMCQCKVLKGGGTLSSVEESVFTKKELSEGWRLGCQVKVKKNIEISLSDEVSEIKEYVCEVVSNRNVSTFIKELILKMPVGHAMIFKSGSYIHFTAPPAEVDFLKDVELDAAFRSDWDKLNVWNLKMKNMVESVKPFSLANSPSETTKLTLNIRLSTPPIYTKPGTYELLNPGVCSSYAFSLKLGDKVTISGPFGHFHLKSTNREMLFIGGGAGMAPIRSHILHLFHDLKTDRKVSFWYGGRSLKELFYMDDFEKIQQGFPNFTFHVALSEPKAEDNWQGHTGFVHQVISDHYLKQHAQPHEIEYYLCGPPLMHAAVLKMLKEIGVKDEMIAFDDFGS